MKVNAHVYVLQAADGSLKVGHSCDVNRRSEELRKQHGDLRLVHVSPRLGNAERIERAVHRLLSEARRRRTEWFDIDVEQVIAAIEQATSDLEGRTFSARTRLFSMRTDNDEGADFLAALDELREDERPVLSRTDMVKKLVFDAQKRRRRK